MDFDAKEEAKIINEINSFTLKHAKTLESVEKLFDELASKGQVTGFVCLVKALRDCIAHHEKILLATLSDQQRITGRVDE